jgi:ubiquitin C-terminal hydrolase
VSSTEVEHMIIDVSPLDFLDDLHERSMESPSSQIVSEVNHEQTSTDMLSSLLVSQDEEKEWNITIRTDIWETEESE